MRGELNYVELDVNIQYMTFLRRYRTLHLAQAKPRGAFAVAAAKWFYH